MQPAYERLYGAASVLVTSGNIKNRLSEAYQRHLADLDPAQVPAGIREDYSALIAALTRVAPQKGETAVAATVRKMSNEEADRCAAAVVGMLAHLYRAQVASAGPPAEVLTLKVAEA